MEALQQARDQREDKKIKDWNDEILGILTLYLLAGLTLTLILASAIIGCF